MPLGLTFKRITQNSLWSSVLPNSSLMKSLATCSTLSMPTPRILTLASMWSSWLLHFLFYVFDSLVGTEIKRCSLFLNFPAQFVGFILRRRLSLTMTSIMSGNVSGSLITSTIYRLCILPPFTRVNSWTPLILHYSCCSWIWSLTANNVLLAPSWFLIRNYLPSGTPWSRQPSLLGLLPSSLSPLFSR